MADKFMYISNDDTQNYPFCWLKLVVETFGKIRGKIVSFFGGSKLYGMMEIKVIKVCKNVEEVSIKWNLFKILQTW